MWAKLERVKYASASDVQYFYFRITTTGKNDALTYLFTYLLTYSLEQSHS